RKAELDGYHICDYTALFCYTDQLHPWAESRVQGRFHTWSLLWPIGATQTGLGKRLLSYLWLRKRVLRVRCRTKL
ncbi:MAG: hypothetical protein PHH90_11335, partial [Limnochordia bacterium]|nr:hypothetical protein [Limnochordia bacterium]